MQGNIRLGFWDWDGNWNGGKREMFIVTFLWHLLLQKRICLASLRTNVIPLLG